MKSHKITLCYALIAGLALGASCADDSGAAGVEICDNGLDDNNDGLVDCQDAECFKRMASCKTRTDAGSKDLTADGASLPDVSLQSVANKMILPVDGAKVGLDITGDAKVDNRIGDLLKALEALNKDLDLQKDLTEQIEDGTLLLLQELRSGSLKDAATARFQLFFGTDLDKNPKDNFTGTEWFGINSQFSSTTPLNGKVKLGVGTFGPGQVMVPVPLGKIYVVVTLKKAKVVATLSAKGITNGQVAGAVLITDIKNRLLPGLATEMSRQLADKANLTPAGLKLLEYFDTNKDGIISFKELATNQIIKTVLLDQPDIDTDGDNKPDAVSVGIGFSSVPCKIQRME